MLAVREGHAAIVDRLLAHGAEVGPKAQGLSALSLAINTGHDDIAKRLLEAGADPNELYPGPRGVMVSVLMLSVALEREPVVVALLEKGAALDFRIDNGRTALDFAETRGNPRIIQLLKEADAARRHHP
jgi:ankyrin repeat protein